MYPTKDKNVNFKHQFVPRTLTDHEILLTACLISDVGYCRWFVLTDSFKWIYCICNLSVLMWAFFILMHVSCVCTWWMCCSLMGRAECVDVVGLGPHQYCPMRCSWGMSRRNVLSFPCFHSADPRAEISCLLWLVLLGAFSFTLLYWPYDSICKLLSLSSLEVMDLAPFKSLSLWGWRSLLATHIRWLGFEFEQHSQKGWARTMLLRQDFHGCFRCSERGNESCSLRFNARGRKESC